MSENTNLETMIFVAGLLIATIGQYQEKVNALEKKLAEFEANIKASDATDQVKETVSSIVSDRQEELNHVKFRCRDGEDEISRIQCNVRNQFDEIMRIKGR